MAEVTKEEAAAATSKTSNTTVKYRCIRNCYWNKQCFDEGDTVSVPSNIKVPEHFVKVD